MPGNLAYDAAILLALNHIICYFSGLLQRDYGVPRLMIFLSSTLTYQFNICQCLFVIFKKTLTQYSQDVSCTMTLLLSINLCDFCFIWSTILCTTKNYEINFQQNELSNFLYDQSRIYLDERRIISHFVQMRIFNIAPLYNLVI